MLCMLPLRPPVRRALQEKRGVVRVALLAYVAQLMAWALWLLGAL